MSQLHVLMMPDYRQGNPYQQLLADALDKAGVSVVFPQGYRRILPIFRAVREQSPPISVLHLHWLEPYINKPNPFLEFIYSIKFLTDILLVRCSGTTLVWTVHNQIEHDTIFPWLERWIRQILIKLASYIIVHNESSLEYLKKEYKLLPEKSQVISHGHYRTIYPLEIDKGKARQKLALPLDRRLYLHIGSLRPYKGIEYLLEVWQTHKDVVSESFLLIAGYTYDVHYIDKLQTLVTQTDHCTLHFRFIEAEQIHIYFSAADVVILPYTRILTSGSLILAMSYGKPIIAPRLGAIPETLEPADWLLYDPTDSQGLSHALQKSLTCSLENLGKLTVQACDRLDWDSIGLKTAQCFQHSFLEKQNSKKSEKV